MSAQAACPKCGSDMGQRATGLWWCFPCGLLWGSEADIEAVRILEWRRADEELSMLPGWAPKNGAEAVSHKAERCKECGTELVLLRPGVRLSPRYCQKCHVVWGTAEELTAEHARRWREMGGELKLGDKGPSR